MYHSPGGVGGERHPGDGSPFRRKSEEFLGKLMAVFIRTSASLAVPSPGVPPQLSAWLEVDLTCKCLG